MSLARHVLLERFEAHVSRDDPDGHWRWTGARSGDGDYGRMRVGQLKIPAHVVAYELFVGPIPIGLTLDHICKLPSCVNPEHLHCVTMAINRRRASDVKLSAADVEEIRTLYRSGRFTQQTLAEMFDLNQSSISHIVNHKRWSSEHKPFERRCSSNPFIANYLRRDAKAA